MFGVEAEVKTENKVVLINDRRSANFMKKTILFISILYLFARPCCAEVKGTLSELEQSGLFRRFGFTTHMSKELKTGRKSYLYRDKKNNLIEITLNDDGNIRKQTLVTFTTGSASNTSIATPQLVFSFVSEASGGQVNRRQFDLMLNRCMRQSKAGGILEGFNVEIIHSAIEGETEKRGLLTLTISKAYRKNKNFIPLEIYLEGIIYDKTNPVAIVNGRAVKVGDEIDGVKVSEIGEDKVIFQHKGKIFSASLESPAFIGASKPNEKQLSCDLEKGTLGNLQVDGFASRSDIINIMGQPEEVEEEIRGKNYKYFDSGIIVLLTETSRISRIYVYYSDLEEFDGYYRKFRGTLAFLTDSENMKSIKKRFGVPADKFKDPIFGTPEFIYKKPYGELHFCFSKSGKLNLVIMASD